MKSRLELPSASEPPAKRPASALIRDSSTDDLSSLPVVVSQHPLIVLFRAFITPRECTTLIAMSAVVEASREYALTAVEWESAEQRELLSDLENRIGQITGCPPHTEEEALLMMHKPRPAAAPAAGRFNGLHVDTNGPGKEGLPRRFATALLYLSTPCERRARTVTRTNLALDQTSRVPNLTLPRISCLGRRRAQGHRWADRLPFCWIECSRCARCQGHDCVAQAARSKHLPHGHKREEVSPKTSCDATHAHACVLSCVPR